MDNVMYNVFQIGFNMHWITDGGSTYVGQATRVDMSLKGTGVFRVMKVLSELKTWALRPSIQRLRLITTLNTEFWDKHISTYKGMFLLNERVRSYNTTIDKLVQSVEQ